LAAVVLLYSALSLQPQNPYVVPLLKATTIRLSLVLLSRLVAIVLLYSALSFQHQNPYVIVFQIIEIRFPLQTFEAIKLALKLSASLSPSCFDDAPCVPGL
jgi:hypothetical protein